MTDFIVTAGISLLGAAIVFAVALLLWCRRTLLTNVATVNLEDVDPKLLAKIERLQFEYDVADELNYPGEVLVHLEAQLNSAKLAATSNPDTISVVLVAAPPPSPNAGAVLSATMSNLIGTQLTWPDLCAQADTGPSARLQPEGL